MIHHFLLLAFLGLQGCGTHVDAGDNLEAQTPEPGPGDGGSGDGSAEHSGDAKGRKHESDADPAGPNDSELGDDEDGGDAGEGGATAPGEEPGGGGGEGGSSGVKLTCFGPAPELKGGIQAFCDGLGADLRATFAKSYDWVCNQRRLVNLFLRPCSWAGDNASERYRRVLEKTDLSDMDSQDFAFLGAYGMTSQSTPEEHTALIFREMTDPDYEARFVTIRNSRLSDVTLRPQGGFEYSVEFASSAATVGFRAALHAETFGNLTAVFDYAVSGQVLVKEHRFLRLMLPGDAGTTRIVAIDEKLISDGGQHQVAYQNLTEVLKQRMERDYENSRRD